ncbi:hypothetical protein HLH26_12765 [Gluconacetobacter sp. 1b LMG 1731]|uniref:Uncharacterized protein n=1 Tax=Gluconacetobacter dulcium TaxID=2729096 RepID=A0A7W4NT84_9PROT|nr:hypothetical protein [Gluconacetobacter dulcium]MBB2165389.1 hypothetical protein [Gluconacetobacter dulcium]MBB2194444.1 hypothetical protein [Gluconacetobacter dulcium]
MSVTAAGIASAATMWALCLIGAVGAYLGGSQKGFTVSHEKMRVLLPGRSDTTYAWIEMVGTVFFGTIAGMAIYSPHSAYQAIAAGVTGPSTIMVYFSPSSASSRKGKKS